MARTSRQPTLIPARTPAHLTTTRELFREYSASLDIDLCFQGFEAELAELPGRYAPPSGEILLAESDGHWLGCVALRELAPQIAEMKRLYVRPTARGLGLGRLLTQAILDAARDHAYRAIRLDTLATMESAIRLYESLGFRDIKPYYPNPIPGARYFEKTL